MNDNESARFLMPPSTNLIRGLLVADGIQIKNQDINSHRPKKSNTITECISSCLSSSYSSSVPHSGEIPSTISYDSIIWCEFCRLDDPNLIDHDESENLIEVTYCHGDNKNLTPVKLKILIDKSSILINENVVDKIMSASYPLLKPQQSILVIINPHGGQGKALRLYNEKCKPILESSKSIIEYKETNYYQHAIDIAKGLDISKYDIIACCSGDGIPHEVINGLYKRDDYVDCFNKLIVTQLPCGSGNAMAESTFGTNEPSNCTLNLLKSKPVKIDLMSVLQGTGSKAKKSISFLSQTYGIIADSDIGTEYLRFMGPARFDIGVTVKVYTKARYPCELKIKYLKKYKDELKTHYIKHLNNEIESVNSDLYKLNLLDKSNFELKSPPLDQQLPNDWESLDQSYADNMGIFYVGKMPFIANNCQFFPAALPNDGAMDLVLTDSRTSVFKTTPILLSLDSGSHVKHDEVQHSKILAYRLTPKTDSGYISIDGESFPFEPLQVEILPGIMTGLLKDGKFASTNFEK